MADKWLDEAPPHLHSSARADYLAARRELFELLRGNVGDQTARSIIQWAENRARNRSTPEELRQLADERATHHQLNDKEREALVKMLLAYGGGKGASDIYDTFHHQAAARATEHRTLYTFRAKICIAIATIALLIAGGFALAELNVLFWTFAAFAAAMAVYGVHQWGEGGFKAVEEMARGAAENEPPVADAQDDRETYVHTLQTSKGHVIITWSAARPDIRAAIQHSPDAASRPILAKLAEILKANPDADLKKYEKVVGIELREVERTWELHEDPRLKLARERVATATSLVEIEAQKVQFFHDNNIGPEHPQYAAIGRIFDDAIEAITMPERI